MQVVCERKQRCVREVMKMNFKVFTFAGLMKNSRHAGSHFRVNSDHLGPRSGQCEF